MTDSKNLYDMRPQNPVPIMGLRGPDDLVQRLRELGFTQGQPVRVINISVFGEPMTVEVRGALLSLRRQEARCILL